AFSSSIVQLIYFSVSPQTENRMALSLQKEFMACLDWMVLSLCLVREMSIQIKLRSYPTSITMFKEKHKKMSLDVPRHPYHLIIYHSSSIGWVGLSDVLQMIQIKQYCLQKLKTAYNLQVWQAVKQHFLCPENLWLGPLFNFLDIIHLPTILEHLRI
ncbi:hypothetical protein ACJX0J_024447, partial [Zea mays]